MKAKEYLKKQLSDPYIEATSIQTQTALAAYAIRMYEEVEGYSISELELLLKNSNIIDETFIKRCTSFVSDCNSFIMCQSRIPILDD